MIVATEIVAVEKADAGRHEIECRPRGVIAARGSDRVTG